MTLPLQYAFEGTEVRVVMISGEPWFVASDVCAALNLPNTTMALSRLDADEQANQSAVGKCLSALNYRRTRLSTQGRPWVYTRPTALKGGDLA